MMISIARTLLAISPLFVGGILATSNQNLLQTCGVFAEIGSGFNTATSFTLTAFDPSELDPTTGGTDLVIAALANPGNPVLFAPPAGSSGTVFNLTDGTIFVIDHEADISFTAALLTNGSDVSFTPTSGAPLNFPQWCAVADTDPEQGTPFPTLALNGTTGDFALCESTVATGTQIVVFRPAGGNSEYDASTCASVNIRLTGPAFE
ncbi:hypothetical protein Clacol_010602 [Clathrus columnatus]|uniref:Uncharacterized protein n=1 Tax=Clathrus columnatus TaxID=1419009 RepID=A0AAV5AM29_9AGAM|nr:hypothetical protein Clacol_009025 [Clathrus columnatus]GJJ16305.1 hypothetical protein Clacol_010602 [Clathrus columnatus]